jgi:hypothetical protein
MAYNEKECTRIREIFNSTLDRSNLSEEELKFACEWTLGDLIAYGCFTLVEATTFSKLLKLESKRRQALGFNVKNPQVVKESKQFLAECDAMCKMAGLDELTMIDDQGCGCDEDEYHPEENDDGGVTFEDHGAGEQAGMIKSNLQSIASKAQSLHDTIGDMDELPEWVQEKIAVADEMIDTISDYLGYEYKRKRSM